MILVVKLYQVVIADIFTPDNYSGDIVGYIFGNFGQFFLAPALLIFLLFTANSMAKKLLGEA